MDNWGAYLPTSNIIRNKFTLQIHQKLAIVKFFIYYNNNNIMSKGKLTNTLQNMDFLIKLQKKHKTKTPISVLHEKV